MAAAAPLRAQSDESIAVLVNDDPISAYDIEQRERFLGITTHAQPSAELKKKATDMLIDELLQVQQAKKLSIKIDDSDINKVISGMADKNHLTAEGLSGALGQMGVNIKTMKDRIRAQMLWQQVVRQKFRGDITIGDSDVDKAMESSGTDQAAPGTSLQLSQIKFEVPSNADQRTLASRLAEADALRAKFNSCSNVAELTKGIQGATYKALPDQAPTSLAQPMRTLVMNAKVGQMTPPTVSASGIELYAVCGKSNVKGDPKVRDDTQRKLMNDEMGIRADKLLRDLREDAFIEYR